MKLRDLGVKFIIAIAAIIVTLIFSEGLMRLFLGNRINRWINYQDSNFGWSHYPNSKGVIRSVDFTVYLDINSKGLREREYGYKKPPGTKRIIILGDSYVQAVGVNIDDSFQKILERKLNSDFNFDKFEVIGAGVGGYSTDQELLFYQLELYKYNPDLVILVFYTGNDVLGNGAFDFSKLLLQPIRKPYFTLNAKEELVLNNFPYRRPETVIKSKNFFSSFGRRIQRDFLEHFVLYRYLKDNLEKFPAILAFFTNLDRKFEPLSSNEIKLMSEDSFALRQSWLITEQLLLRLKNEIESRGGKLAIIIIPRREQIEQSSFVSKEEISSLDKAHSKLDIFFKKHNIYFLDLLVDLRNKYEKSNRH